MQDTFPDCFAESYKTIAKWDEVMLASSQVMLEARKLLLEKRGRSGPPPPPEGQIAPVASSLVLGSPSVAQIAPVASSIVPCSPPVAPTLALRDNTQAVAPTAPIELFTVEHEWQLSSCFEKARHVSIAFAKTYDFDNKGMVRANEVIEGFC